MYFVTIKQPGYCLFATTPSERFAVGLRDDQYHLHLLAREGSTWRIVRELTVEEHSHTDVMLRLGAGPEPDTVEALVQRATGR